MYIQVQDGNSCRVFSGRDFSNALQRCERPTAYRVRSVRVDGAIMRRRKPVYVWVNPWRSHGMHGASVFVCGECALASTLAALLRVELNTAVSGYGVYHVVRSIGADMERDIKALNAALLA